MAEKKLPLLGRIAIQLKMIDMDQLNQATREQGLSPEKRLGQILVEQGFVTAKDLEKLAAVQKDLIAKHQARKDAELKAETRAPNPRHRDKRRIRRVGPARSNRTPWG
jgi:hypothetical protein